MYGKLLIIFALVVVALGQKYPAGLHPAVCPNYPFCDTQALARHTADGTPIPEWVRNPSILPAPVPNYYAAGSAAAPRYPANFPAALCPNYPFC